MSSIIFIFVTNRVLYANFDVKDKTSVTSTHGKPGVAVLHKHTLPKKGIQIQPEEVQRRLNDHKETDDGGKKILIFTSYRSGSSFIGEILKHQQSTFYTFEPFNFLQFQNLMSTRATETLLSRNVSHYLSNLFRCNFQPLQRDSLKYFPLESGLRTAWIPRCFNGARSFEQAEDICKERKNKISKIIRVKYVKDIIQVIQENITIIHLIRDPRGTIASRMKIVYDADAVRKWIGNDRRMTYMKIKAKAHCLKLKENYEYVASLLQTQDTPVTDKLRQRYIVVRYEDFAYHPKDMTKRLIDFLETNPIEAFYRWLNAITNGENPNPYSVFRQSNVTAEAWRKYLPYSFVDVIQDACQDVLTYYGYQLVTSEEEMHDEKRIFVSKLPEFLPQL